VAPYATETLPLLDLANDDRESVKDALEAGAFDIDAAFSQGGYVVPIDPTDVTDADLSSRLAAKLSELNRTKAASILSSGTSRGKKGQADVIKKDLKACEDFLKLVSKGELAIPGLARVGGAQAFLVATSDPPSYRQDLVANARAALNLVTLQDPAAHVRI
jgi:hypothetical protein